MARPKKTIPEVTPPERKEAKIESKATAYIVAQRFYDRGNVSKVYEVGEDVSHLDGERLEGLVGKGLVELR